MPLTVTYTSRGSETMCLGPAVLVRTGLFN